MGSQRASQRRVIASPPEEEVAELASSSGSEEEQEWEARAILDERTIPNPDYKRSKSSIHSSRFKRAGSRTITQYLIDWEGFNPETGERWEPSWENGDGATQGLIDEWMKRKETDPEVVGRYTRNVEEKKRRAAAKEKFQRKGLAGQSVTPKKASTGRATSGSAVKAAGQIDVPAKGVIVEHERDSDSPSTSRSITSERRKRRNIVTSPISPDDDAETENSQDLRRKGSTSRRQVEAVAGKADRASSSKRERGARDETKRIEEVADSRRQKRRQQLSDASPAIAGKRKRSSPSSERGSIPAGPEEDTVSHPNTSKAGSESREPPRDGESRKAKKRKLLVNNGNAGAEKDNVSARADRARQEKSSGGTEDDASRVLNSVDASKKSRRADGVEINTQTERITGRRKAELIYNHPLRTQLPKQSAEPSPDVNRSQVTNSPSIVGDSQPALNSSGESLESHTSQRTPSDLGRSDAVRRLAISRATNQASLVSPKLPRQEHESPSLRVNAEAGPSRLAGASAAPHAASMDVDQEFVPNSLFAMHSHTDQDDSSDMPQSQAIALQRAIDLLMMEENFLEREQAARSPLSTSEPIVEADFPASEAEPLLGPAVESIADGDAALEESAGKEKESSKRGARKPFAAVDDFTAQAQSAAFSPSIPAQTAATSKLLHPLPQIAPSVFRDAGIAGTQKSSLNTQPDSIHDFDSPRRNTGDQESAATSTVQVNERDVATNATTETEVIIEQIISQMPAASAETCGQPREGHELQVPNLGDVWSELLNNATIDPSMLGKSPGAMVDEQMSSSEDNSYRSDENAPPEVPVQSTTAGVAANASSSHPDLLIANAKLQVLKSDLARSRLESKQLEVQVQALKADLQASNDSHADSYSQSDSFHELEEQVKTLKTDLEKINDKYIDARSQWDFYKDLYDRAGGTTMRLKRENEELAEDNVKLKAHVVTGLKQKQLFLDSFVEAKDREIEQLKAQNEMLLQQAQKTDKLREYASRLPQVEAHLRQLEAERAACPKCSRHLDSQILDDSDTEYQPHKKIVVIADTERRSARSRSRAEQEAAAPKAVERYVPVKSVLHVPEQALQSVEARRKLPMTDLRRWAHDRDIVVSAEAPPQTQLGLDIAEVGTVHICKWRPEHGNSCCALFANIEDLANHALTHLLTGQESSR
ncbi:hypothetical protein NliqN6_5255 [Naganishia liquefaciens]|uniref:Chromo domain-containing protein n=1 Tax=Naganishia liquefaciens TaxID=104408 RepID=A0A8H3YH06_9TREE|nr:hypothetical protein NliqN6_5255 [Naganishia liquefaciens]